MASSSLLARADAGEVLRGYAVAFPSPGLVEFGGYAGFDWTFIDAHQAAINPETCEEMIRAAQVSGMVAFVRIPSPDPSLISPYLDMGATGVVVPHLNTAELAREVAAAARFRPRGRRGSNMAARAARYTLIGPASSYQERFNREAIVVGMLEEQQAVENLPAILAVPGIDLFMLGLMDLAESLGLPGEWQHPQVQRTVDEIVRQVRAAGRHVCLPTMDLEAAPSFVEELPGRGIHFTVVGCHQLLAWACQRFLGNGARGPSLRASSHVGGPTPTPSVPATP